MGAIWRVELNLENEGPVIRKELPVGAQLLSVAPGRREGAYTVDVWAIVQPDAELAPIEFEVVGTGHRVPEPGLYVGTAVMPDGFVWHVFRLPRR